MIKRIPTNNLSETEWQELRSTFVREGMVGGSDASTILGINKYKSSINLYYQSLAEANLPNKMNGAMLHGKQLEKYVADCWQYYDGTEEGWVENTLKDNKIKRYSKINAILINDKYPFLFANVDARIKQHPVYGKKPGILEVKTISGYSADSYEGGIPPGYLFQLQHYLLVTGYTWGEIVYLKDGRELGCLTFEADKDLQQMIIDAASDYHNRIKLAKELISSAESEEERQTIIAGLEPLADSTQAFNLFISERHKARENEVVMTGNEQHEEWAIAYQSESEEISQHEEQKRLMQNRLKQVMETNKAVVMMLPNGGKITWRKQFNVKL